MAAAAPRIVLTELEEKVFGALLKAANHFSLGTTVRAAGGWVRDKLLGKASDDIDIVVDNMSGEEFALKVSEYMSQCSEGGMVSNVGVVKQNPDQSKHLATACFRVYGLSLDVNNLRTETYAEESRIPVTSIGTPTEDAQRRDFTVNALFYNLNTRAVEDLTGHGLADLTEGVIRTPLPAAETFRDDPLRILRALRFAARLGFRLDEGTLAAASDSAMHRLLETKVSRERFGIEVDKMMKAAGTRPAQALELMGRLGLLGPVFLSAELLAVLPPGQASLEPSALATGAGLAAAVAELLQAEEPQQELRVAMYASLLSAWAGLSVLEKKKQRPLIPALLRAALRIDHLACEAAQDVAVAGQALHSGSGAEGAARSRHVGAQLCIAKERWLQALALAVVLGGARGDAARQAFAQQRQWVATRGLEGCWAWRPLVDGKRLMAPPFQVPRGPRLGEAVEAQLQWRLEDPQLAEEECSSRLQELVKSWQAQPKAA